MLVSNEYTLYTDGSTVRNPGPGGYAGMLLRGEEVVGAYSGGKPTTTNNLMELEAVLEGLARVPNGATVEVVCDAEYVLKGARDWLPGWKRRNWFTSTWQPVKNQSLWMEMDEELRRVVVTWTWVKGHVGADRGGHANNHVMDDLAKRAARRADETGNSFVVCISDTVAAARQKIEEAPCS